MCQVCFVAQDHELVNTIGEKLGPNARCKLLCLSELQASAESYFSQPSLLIVDLQFVSPSQAKQLDEFSRNYPETFIVPVASADSQLPVDDFMSWGVEEVMVRPQNSAQKPGVIARLLNRIATLEHIASLQDKLRQKMGGHLIVAKSKPLRDLMQQLPLLAESNSTILITGETGSGKELIARAIHYLGARAGQPFVTVDCGAIPEHLIENELFGHARGAYTNADAPAKGLIAEAGAGTLFLDEVEALPLTVQSKFLRLLQEHQFRPLGQTKYVQSSVRIIAASNIDLVRAVEKKAFRPDLYYRLNVVPLYIPPLRKRKADLPSLVKHFLRKYSPASVPAPALPNELFREWLAYEWPGNVRELENKVQAWLLQKSCKDEGESIFFAPTAMPRLRSLAEVRHEALARCERAYLHTLLLHTHGNVSAAARFAGIHRKNLAALFKKYAFNTEDYRH